MPLFSCSSCFARLAKPGAKRQTQEGVAGWPDFDPDFTEEPGVVEPYLSAILVSIIQDCLNLRLLQVRARSVINHPRLLQRHQPALHHFIQHRQKRLDLLLAVHDLHY